jgi:4-oxalocrotonate tautomerase
MPFIAVHIARGRSLEKRRRLAAAITEVVTEILELEKGATQVLIHEHDRDNWAVGGELLSERQKTSELLDLDALFKKPVSRAARKAGSKASLRTAQAKPRSRR